MAITETEPNEMQTHDPDPARMLIRMSAVLSVIMAVIAGILIWRSRTGEAPIDEPRTAIPAPGVAPEPDYTFTVNPATDKPAAVSSIMQDFELIERSGKKVTNQDLLGKPWVASFIFVNCAGPCMRVTGQIKLLQDRFADKPVTLVTITVDPERDTPEALANYADNFGAEPDWLFLTKDQQTIYPLIRDSFGLSVQEETGPNRKPGWEITHSTRVVHVDATGHIRGKYNALDPVEMAQLVHEVERELKSLPQDAGQSSSKRSPRADDADSPVEAPVPAIEGATGG